MAINPKAFLVAAARRLRGRKSDGPSGAPATVGAPRPGTPGGPKSGTVNKT